ncbi:hypothetical protein ACIBG4_41830 [Nonomuraea sp. NPDC050383]|uniref:hypothetical protein n=1 Tax=Nonomuraea sp. NPDC050383 TaxID=3364362 RepID=UPI003792B125
MTSEPGSLLRRSLTPLWPRRVVQVGLLLGGGVAMASAAVALALVLTSGTLPPTAPPTIPPHAPAVDEHRATARKLLGLRLDWAARTGRFAKELGRSGLDRCRRGNDDAKNQEDFAAICVLSLYRAYTWNGDVDALLARFRRCPEAVEKRAELRESGTRADRAPDVEKVTMLVCDGVTMEFATARTEASSDLMDMPGAGFFDEDGGMYEPYHWAPEGTPWLAEWLKRRQDGRFLVALGVSEEYSVLADR